MEKLNFRLLKDQASQQLSSMSEDPRKLVLIHTGVIVLISLIVNLLNLVLDQMIGSTGGLSGLGTRSVLETIQSILSYVSIFFTPFWSAGFLYCVIRLVRCQQAHSGNLLEGFRRFTSVLMFYFLKSMLIFFVASSVTYLATALYMFTPFSAHLNEVTSSLLESGSLMLADGTVNLSAIPKDLIIESTLPLLFIFLAIFIPVVAVVNYSLRLSEFFIMEGPRIGGFVAMMKSMKIMKGHKLDMLKLDLSFWWYYLIEALLAAVLYLDVILPLLGITIPFNPMAIYFILIILYGILQIAFHLWAKLPVDMTYVLAYQAISSDTSPSETNPSEMI